MEDKKIEKRQSAYAVEEVMTKSADKNNNGSHNNLALFLEADRYKKRWQDSLDRRFLNIFLITLAFNMILVIYLSHLPYQMSTNAVRKVQEHYANFIFDKKAESVQNNAAETQGLAARQKANKGAGEGGSKNESSARNASGRGGVINYSGSPGSTTSSAEERMSAHTRSTNEIAQEVSNKGILALLTGNGTAAQGNGVVDILGESGGGEGKNLDKVLTEINGLKSSGAPGGGTGSGGGSARGSRVTGSGSGGGSGIGDLVDGLTQVQTTDFGKKTEKMVVSQSKVEAEAGKSAGRNAEAVLAVINSHRSAIEYCYQRALRQNPNLKGKVSLRFVIRADGSVGDVTVLSSTLGDPAVESCIVAKIRSWRDFGPIDAAKGDAIFRQDYIFGY